MGFYVEYSFYDQVCDNVRECPDTTGSIPGVNHFVAVLYEYVGAKLVNAIGYDRVTQCYADEL
jgi:hypothetical protein